MTEEIWRKVQEYDGYEVSNLGRLRSYLHAKQAYILKLDNCQRYSRIHLMQNKKGSRKMVHRLVAGAFIPNPLNKPQINHKNGSKKDNKVENLEWCTNSENQLHSYRVLGNKHTPKVKLSEYDVMAIKKLKAVNPKLSQMRLGRMFGMDQTTISLILNNKLEYCVGIDPIA